MKKIKSLTETELNELPELPKGWKWVKLGEHSFVTKLAGFEFTKYVKYKEKGEIPVIRAQNVSKREFIPTNFVYVDRETMEKLPRSRIRGGELLMVFVGSVGNVSIVPSNKEYFLGPNVAKIDLEEHLNNKYVLFFLSSILGFGNVSGMSKATTQSSISMGNIREVIIPFVALEEQSAIVSKIEQFFSELDNGIANLKLAQEQLKVYRQAVLKKAFGGELTRKWRVQETDLPDAEDLLEQIRKEREEAAKTFGKKLKQVKPLTEDELDDLDKLPNEWKWIKIGDITLGVEYGTSAKSKESGDAVVLRMGNIQNGRFDWNDLAYTNDEAEIEKYLLRKDDVLFNRTNSPELVGKTAIYKGERTAIFAGYLIRINQLPTLVVADYLNYFLNCSIAKVHGNSVKTDGVNQSNINGEKLGNYPFPFCSIPEQHTIVQEIDTRLSVCDKIEQDIEMNLEKAEALRQSILKKAFKGKLLNEKELAEVRNAEDWEPAEVLLERIKAEKAGYKKKLENW